MLSRILQLLIMMALWFAFGAGAAVVVDPPARVGRLAHAEGSVTVHNATLGQWEEAVVNWPLTSGDSLATGADGRAELRVGSTALRLDHDTEVRIERLDDQAFVVWLEHGSVALRLRSDDAADRVAIDTRDGRVLADEPGRYRVDYAHATTMVAAEHGRIAFVADDMRIDVAPREQATIWRAGATYYRVGAVPHDDFAAWVLARDGRDDALGAPRHVSPEMTGAEDLAAYGEWREAGGHGPVWYPHHVPVGWAPYRDGRWVWVEPWGWTWLDEAPWGFAPFHYGRWANIGSRWAWVPGAYTARPVYAPALVMWIGSPGWSIRFSFGHAPAIGWFPLGPRDVFVPRFHASPRFVHKVNVAHVTNVTEVVRTVRDPQRARFAFRDHRDAVTVVPLDTLVHGRRIARSGLREPLRATRGVRLTTRVPAFERHGAPRQARERSLRLDERRRERRADDLALRAQRARAFASGTQREPVQTQPTRRDDARPAVRTQGRDARLHGRTPQRRDATPPSPSWRSERSHRQQEFRGTPRMRDGDASQPRNSRSASPDRRELRQQTWRSEQAAPSRPSRGWEGRGERAERQNRFLPQRDGRREWRPATSRRDAGVARGARGRDAERAGQARSVRQRHGRELRTAQ